MKRIIETENFIIHLDLQLAFWFLVSTMVMVLEDLPCILSLGIIDCHWLGLQKLWLKCWDNYMKRFNKLQYRMRNKYGI